MKRLLCAVSLLAYVTGCQSAVLPAASQARVRGSGQALSLDDVFALGSHLKISSASFGGWTGSGHDFLASEGSLESSRLVIVDASSGVVRALHDDARMEAALACLSGISADLAKSIPRRKSANRRHRTDLP